MTEKAYRQAIDILMGDSIAYRHICIELAKRNPNLFIEIAGDKTTDDKLLNLMLSGKKVEAIKQCRDVYGMSLKEAKDHVEALEVNGRDSDTPKEEPEW